MNYLTHKDNKRLHPDSHSLPFETALKDLAKILKGVAKDSEYNFSVFSPVYNRLCAKNLHT